MIDLYDWQEKDVAKWVAAAQDGTSTSVFVAWEQSLGKTVAASTYAARLGVKTIIIVAPLNTKRSWMETFAKQYPALPFKNVTNKPSEIIALNSINRKEAGVYFIGWELMRTGMLDGMYADLIIADETHRQQNRGSHNHNMIKGLKSSYKMALSGTPAGNRPDGIFATISWLWPDRYPSHQRWVDTFWRVIRNGQIIEFVREQTPGGVLADLPMFSRRLRKDHRKDLPASLPEQRIDVALSAKQRKLYNQLKESSAAWIGDTFVPTALPLIQDLRMTQITLGVPTVDEQGEITFALNCTSSKMAALFDVIAGEPEDATFLVLVSSARFVPAAVAQLNAKHISAEGFSGTLTPANSKAREDVLDGFGTRFRILVASIAAIAEGTDGLQYKSSRQFFLSKHANRMLNEQVKWRLDRPGQTEPVQSWFTVAEDTIDVDKVERQNEIGETLDAFIDAPRGTNLE